MARSGTIRIGGLAPLSTPGWTEAGRQLAAGLVSGTQAINDAGGAAGRPLELIIRDTGAGPDAAAAAVRDLAKLGVTALGGEFHSVAARAAAREVAAAGLPFLCSSAVFDRLTDEPTELVARIAPMQSYSWRCYAAYLQSIGHRDVAAVLQPSPYWEAGVQILRDYFEARGGRVRAMALDPARPAAILGEIKSATALLLLTGHPEPAISIVSAIRSDPRFERLLIGTPAGQAEFPSWQGLAQHAAGIPFLRYLPETLTPLGSAVAEQLGRTLGEAPSFIALEGHDTALVLGDMLRWRATAGGPIDAYWRSAKVAGTRGTITFARPIGSTVWQWTWPPVQISDRDPALPSQFWTLRHC